MKWLRCRFTTLLLICMLTLMLALVGIWIRGYFRYDQIFWLGPYPRPDGGGWESYVLQSYPGRIRLLYQATHARSRSYETRDNLRAQARFGYSLRTYPVQDSERNGSFWYRRGFEYTYRDTPSGGGMFVRQWSIGVPIWMPVIVLAIPCLIIVYPRLRDRRRRLRGLCPTCGYDLRATPDRCPECGAMPEAAT